MFLRSALAACAAFLVVSLGALDTQAAGCTGSVRQRIDCLEKQLDVTNAKLEAVTGKLDGVTSRLGTAIETANKAKETAEAAFKKVGEIKEPDLNNVRIQWRVQPGNCLYVEDGTGTVRVATTNPPTCKSDAQQRFDILK